MKSFATGLSVRFFRVTIPTGTRAMGSISAAVREENTKNLGIDRAYEAGEIRLVGCWIGRSPAFSPLVRRVYLDVPHSKNPKPSWYGESIGHYEGDTLVIDTIGFNDMTFIDYFRTPHTEKLHVVERWRMVEDGKVLEAQFTVDDPDAFYQPWSGMRRFRRVEAPYVEEVCAENNDNNLGIDYHIPKAAKPDF
jgi:hypothetical protein